MSNYMSRLCLLTYYGGNFGTLVSSGWLNGDLAVTSCMDTLPGKGRVIGAIAWVWVAVPISGLMMLGHCSTTWLPCSSILRVFTVWMHS